MMPTKLISVARVSQNIICILQNINVGIYQELDQNPDLWVKEKKKGKSVRRCRTKAVKRQKGHSSF